ncbi:MAG: restriction endonuclease subunit S [Dehalococcoidia bacterium]
MNQGFPLVRLGEVLTRAEEWVQIQPEQRYQQVTVRLWGKGVVRRAEVSGAEIAAQRQLIVRPQQFILSRIDARNGALGLVPDSLDGAVVSNDFPVFALNTSRIIPSFLDWMSKTRSFVDLCKAASEGTTNRVRLQEERFLSMEIPLPPLPAQQRIVARIEELAAKIEEARGLRQEAMGEIEAVLALEEFEVWPSDSLEGAPRLAEVTSYLSRGRQSLQGDSDHYLIKTQHVQMGSYLRSNLTLAPDIAARVRRDATARQGDILIACSAAGCLGRVAQYMETNQLASTDTHVAIARPNPNVVTPSYLYAYLRGAQGQVQLRSRERGDWTREKIGFRLIELNLADLQRVPVPVPSLLEQQRIVGYLDGLQAKFDAVKRLQAETAAELEAMLPAALDRAFRGEL